MTALSTPQQERHPPPAARSAAPATASVPGIRMEVGSVRPRTAPADAAAPVVYYAGPRVYFRPLEVGDEPLLRRWINDPLNWRYLEMHPPFNEARERDWLNQLGSSPTDYVFGIALRADDRLVGVTGLHRIHWSDRKATLGINLGERSVQNQGYGTDAVRLVLRFAFEELNLNRVELSVLGNNPRAIRCYQKVGFVQEGCARQAAFRNGQYWDVYRFAVLSAEWQASRETPVLRPQED